MKLSTINSSLPLALLFCLFLVLGAAIGCGGGDEDQAEQTEEPEAEEPAPAAESSSTAPRVFFVNVSEGDEVTSPVSLEFGIENFEIVAAEEPPVIEDGKGHHHLAINAHCLDAGIVIEKAEPWIHFGDASNTIDVQLEPGPVHLSLQIGDGEHRTLDEEGLCAMIDLTVVEDESE